MKFAAVEAVEGRYKFLPLLRSPTQLIRKRIFLYTPLHDYESVWWIATWAVFSCTLNTTKGDETARNKLFSDRAGSFSHHDFAEYGSFLAKELHPLVDILEKMRLTLVSSYVTYEDDFDGSHILDVVPDLVACFRDLVEAAKAIEIKPLRVSSKVERSDMLIDMREDVPGGRGDKDVVRDEAGTNWRKRRRGGSIDSGHPDEKRRMINNLP